MVNLERVERKTFLPVVLTEEEVGRVLAQLRDTPKLMAQLIYGTGQRVMECMQLRIKDLDFQSRTITVRRGQGGEDSKTEFDRKFRQGDVEDTIDVWNAE